MQKSLRTENTEPSDTRHLSQVEKLIRYTQDLQLFQMAANQWLELGFMSPEAQLGTPSLLGHLIRTTLTSPDQTLTPAARKMGLFLELRSSTRSTGDLLVRALVRWAAVQIVMDNAQQMFESNQPSEPARVVSEEDSNIELAVPAARGLSKPVPGRATRRSSQRSSSMDTPRSA